MDRDRADEHEKPASEQGSSDEEEEISKIHKSLFEKARKDQLGWIGLTKDSCPEYADKKSAFQREYEPKFRGGHKENTIIHTLAEEKDKDMSKFKPLLELVLKLDPLLLGVPNDRGETQLHSAIQARNSGLVEVRSSSSVLSVKATSALTGLLYFARDINVIPGKLV
jgi:hypothetical protein